MKKPEKVAVICGGESEEREISLKTGEAVAEALKSAPCEVLILDTELDLGSRLRREKVDVAFVALHGRGGEDGVIQGMLEWFGIPYTGPGVTASALCMDKILSKRIFQQLEIPTAPWFVLESGETVRNKGEFSKMAVKPRCEGSSIGMSIVEADQLAGAVEKARSFASQVLVEEYIDGYELTVGVVKLDQQYYLPPVGIRSSHNYFDYETKYTKGLTEYDVPAPVGKDVLDKLMSCSKKAAVAAGSEDLCRIDYILDANNDPHLLEINTIPGLTATSLLPMAADSAGIPFQELVWGLVCSGAEGSQ